MLSHWQKLLDSAARVSLYFTSRAMAKATLKLIDQGFQGEKDPYGTRWKKKKKPDGRKTLHGPTGRLRRGWKARGVSRRGFTVAPSVSYAAPHQAPRRGRRPRRMMVPDGRRGVPGSWSKIYRKIAGGAVSVHFKRKG